jgi:mersacidin/lichenicidin family type 2 lantibiotic
MISVDIVRSWKDEDYFSHLSSAERSLLPQNPAGLIELTDDELLNVGGGTIPTIVALTIIAGSAAV